MFNFLSYLFRKFLKTTKVAEVNSDSGFSNISISECFADTLRNADKIHREENEKIPVSVETLTTLFSGNAHTDKSNSIITFNGHSPAPTTVNIGFYSKNVEYERTPILEFISSRKDCTRSRRQKSRFTQSGRKVTNSSRVKRNQNVVYSINVDLKPPADQSRTGDSQAIASDNLLNHEFELVIRPHTNKLIGS